jgi:hypothetical protein
MLNAMILAAALAGPVQLAPAVVSMPPPVEWSLEGHLLWNFEDEAPVLGFTYIPNEDYQIGLTVLATRIEWDELYRTTVFYYAGHKPHMNQSSTVEGKHDNRIFAGITWKFR